MLTYTIAIVEDEAVHSATLSEYLQRLAEEEGFEVSLTLYSSAVEAAEGYKSQFDALFLDIQMPGMTGMELAKEIREKDPHVTLVFVTSLAQFAIEGYSVSAADYLLKPLSYPEFRIKMLRAFAKMSKREEALLRLPSGNGIVVIPVSEVIYCETDGHSVIYHATSGDYRRYQAMKEAEKTLENEGFLRINSCYLVSKRFISGVEGHFVILKNGERLLISRPRISAVNAALKELL